MNPQQASSPQTADATPAPLPFVDLKAQYARIKADIAVRLQTVLDHGRFIMGPEIAELERELAVFAGVDHAVGVASGTDALLLTLMAEEIGPGDAVFLPAFTFTATAEVVCAVGAEPVFVDVDAHTFNMDPRDLVRKVAGVRAGGRLTPRAVMAVDLFGLPADYPAIAAIAERDGLHLIADAAQSFGAALGGTRVGALTPVTAVSFFPAKPLGCYGDGGAVFCHDAERAAVLRSLRVHGEGKAKYEIVRIGRNARLDTMQAAVLLAKLAIFEDELARRNAIADRYDALLGNGVVTPRRVPGAVSAWAQYTILVDERDRVKADLQAQGIPTMIYYPLPLNVQPAFACYGDGPGSTPVADELCGRVLSLPIHPYLDDATVDRIAAAVRPCRRLTPRAPSTSPSKREVGRASGRAGVTPAAPPAAPMIAEIAPPSSRGCAAGPSVPLKRGR